MSIREYRDICQKGKLQKKDVPFFYKVHRLWSIYITIAFLKLGMCADTVTMLSFCTGAAALGLLCVPYPWFFAAGCLVYYFSFLLDKCDGEVARYTGVFSARGVYLDELYHFLINGGLFTAVGIRIFAATADSAFLIIGMAATLLCILIRIERKLHFFIYCKSDKFRSMSAGQRASRLLPLVQSKFFGWPSLLTYSDIVIYMLAAFSFIGLRYFLYACLALYGYILLRRIVINLLGGLEKNLALIHLP